MSLPEHVRSLKDKVNKLELAVGHILDDCCDPEMKPQQIDYAKDYLAWIIAESGEILKELGEVAQR